MEQYIKIATLTKKPKIITSLNNIFINDNIVTKNELETYFILILKNKIHIVKNLREYRKYISISKVNLNYLENYKLNSIYSTIYENVFYFYPYSKLVVKNNIIYIEPLYPKKVRGFKNYDDFIKFFENKLDNKLEKNNKIDLSFSGGSDSLFLLSFAIQKKMKCNLNCHLMPGLEKKQITLLKKLKNTKLKYRIFENFSLNQINKALTKFVKINNLPVTDPVAINYFLMYEKINNEIILDGQNADSLFHGLPHNKLLNIYNKIKYFRKVLCFLRFLNKVTVLPDTRFKRYIYRFLKILRSLDSKDWIECFLVSVDLPKKDKKLRYFLECSLKNYSSIDKCIAHFFLFYIIPQREFQKFCLFENKVILPFFDQTLIEKVFSSNPNLIKGKYGKEFIYKRVNEFFNINLKGKTDPFYVKSLKNYNILSESIKLINS